MISDQSKRELKRRRREQLDNVEASIRQLESWLAAGDHQHLLHSKLVGKRYVPLTDEEQKAYLEATLANLKKHHEVWSQPFDFELEEQRPVQIPKEVARAIRRLRKRTCRLLRRKGVTQS